MRILGGSRNLLFYLVDCSGPQNNHAGMIRKMQMGTDSFRASSIPGCLSSPCGRCFISSLANLPNPVVLSPTYILIKSQQSSLVMYLGRARKGVPSHGVVLGNRPGRGSLFLVLNEAVGFGLGKSG